MRDKKIWHDSDETPTNVYVGERLILLINKPAYYFKTLKMTPQGWVSEDGVNITIEEGMGWAYMRDVLGQAIESLA